MDLEENQRLIQQQTTQQRPTKEKGYYIQKKNPIDSACNTFLTFLAVLLVFLFVVFMLDITGIFKISSLMSISRTKNINQVDNVIKEVNKITDDSFLNQPVGVPSDETVESKTENIEQTIDDQKQPDDQQFVAQPTQATRDVEIDDQQSAEVQQEINDVPIDSNNNQEIQTESNQLTPLQEDKDQQQLINLDNDIDSSLATPDQVTTDQVEINNNIDQVLTESDDSSKEVQVEQVQDQSSNTVDTQNLSNEINNNEDQIETNDIVENTISDSIETIQQNSIQSDTNIVTSSSQDINQEIQGDNNIQLDTQLSIDSQDQNNIEVTISVESNDNQQDSNNVIVENISVPQSQDSDQNSQNQNFDLTLQDDTVQEFY